MHLLMIMVTIPFGIEGALNNKGCAARIGSIFSAFAVCVGHAYFGMSPYFGGSHPDATYFGCIMVTFGTIAWLLFRMMSELHPSNTTPPAKNTHESAV
ncbi:MAG: hypothetical protein WCT04_22900 [Planctomycetota bacterium]